MAITTISPAPVSVPFKTGNPMWGEYFTKIYRAVLSLLVTVSADKGDSSVSVQPMTDATTLYFNTPLTATRTVTLGTTTAFNGARFRVVRGAGATGGFNLNVGTGPLKALTAAGQWLDVEYTGSAWILTAYGSL